MKLRIKLIPTILSATLTLSVFGQRANFEVDKKEACDSMLVAFTNGSTPATDKIISGYTFTYTIKKFRRDGTDTTVFRTDANKFSILFKTPGVHIIDMVMMEKKAGATSKWTHSDTIFLRPRPNAYFTVADTFSFKNLAYRFRTGKAFTDTIKYQYKWYLDNLDDKDSVTHEKGSIGVRDLLIKEFPEAFDVTSHTMILKVRDKFGCGDTYKEEFLVASKLVVPNVFTPNGDGNNDLFTVQTNGRNSYSLKIFTSNGALIFESDSRSIEWDGVMSSGAKALPGTYYYVIQPLKTDIATKPEKGFFMLLREKN